MLQTLAFTLLAFSGYANSLALPQGATGSLVPLFPTNTTITFYQGIALATGHIERDLVGQPISKPSVKRDVETCGIQVAEGTIQQGTCKVLLTAAIGIQQTETGICSFTLFRGSDGCDPGPDGANAVKRVVAIPNGEGTTCVGTGVLDGGMYQKASGIWACG